MEGDGWERDVHAHFDKCLVGVGVGALPVCRIIAQNTVLSKATENAQSDSKGGINRRRKESFAR